MLRLTVLLACLLLSACGQDIDSAQSRQCRELLPALSQDSTTFDTIRTYGDADRRGVRLRYFAQGPGQLRRQHTLHCRFAHSQSESSTLDLTSVTQDEVALLDSQLFFLKRFWLETPDAEAADPGAATQWGQVPHVSLPLAYFLQQWLNALPLSAIYGLLAAAYSLVYGLVGRINFAFGQFAILGGYAALFAVILTGHAPPMLIIIFAIGLSTLVALIFGTTTGEWVFKPLSSATGQQGLVATIGLAIFMSEFMRLSQGSGSTWLAGFFNTPVIVAQAVGFSVTITLISLLVGGLAIVSACILLWIIARTSFGRSWRAYSDDPLAAALFGVSAWGIFAQTFALASAFAGISGSIITLYYGNLDYTASLTLGIRALVAAILGGIGSIPGAFIGGIAIGIIETMWSAYFPLAYRDVVIFGILIAILVFRPGGLFGFGDLTPRRV
ncbi:MAG: branched-chain amino acid ABC transporter permease [Hyphomicrobiales bacterium]|nr:branched-chain amino acid ABC transporter permease [Hyphomicrobiales bacterium]MDE2114567.1 branched-chain amino acid ABC transporter permease [Hyphomicrobiales bacterium]